MRKLLTWLCVFTLLGGVGLTTTAQYASDEEFVEALDWMYTQGLTQYETVDAFRPGDVLTRQEAAKFFGGVLSFTILPVEPLETDFDCDFADEDMFDDTLTDAIDLACESGLMKGYDGKFHPNDTLTKAQALTIIGRLYRVPADETKDPRWFDYHAHAYTTEVTKESDPWAIDTPLTRYEAALLLARTNIPPALIEGPPEPGLDGVDLGLLIEQKEIKDMLRGDYLRTH